MKKSEFLDALCRGLRFQPDPDEIRKVVAYYDQAIEDRMEDGMSEEDAVAVMGDMDDIIRETKSAWHEDAAADAASGEDGGPGRAALAYDPAVVRRIDVNDTSGDVAVSPSPDGMIHVKYTATDTRRYEITGESALCIRRVHAPSVERRFDFNLFGRRSSVVIATSELRGGVVGEPDLEILLPPSPAELGVATSSGDVDIHGVNLAAVDLKLADGDASLKSVTVEGKMDVVTASGDVELYEVSTAEASVNTASGDVDAKGFCAGVFTVKTASGDVDAERTEIRERLSAATASGDVDIRLDRPCPAVNVETVSGDVSLELAGSDKLYTVLARAKTGDVDVDGEALDGENQVRLKTLSGDIDVRFRG